MAFRHDEGKGTMFENTNRTSDKQPGFGGSCTVGGEVYRVSAWWNPQDKRFGLRFQTEAEAEKYRQRRDDAAHSEAAAQPNSAPPAPMEPPHTDFDDDIPF